MKCGRLSEAKSSRHGCGMPLSHTHARSSRGQWVRAPNQTCRRLLRQLRGCHVLRFCTDEWKSYRKLIAWAQHWVDKQWMQEMERENLNFRTHLKRLQRRTIGSATALQLANLDPSLASRILLLDKAVFPRPKVCVGGVTVDAELMLGKLGVDIDLPAAPIHTSKFILPTVSLSVQQPNHIRVFRRGEFDYNLFQNALTRGVVTQGGEAVENIIRTLDEVIVQTLRNDYRAEIFKLGHDHAYNW